MEKELSACPSVTSVHVYERTSDIVLHYMGSRQEVIDLLAGFRIPEVTDPDGYSGRRIVHEFEDKIAWHIIKRAVTRLFLPLNLRAALNTVKALPYVKEGLKSLFKGKLEVTLLDATSITAAILTEDYDTAGSYTS